MSKVKSKPLFTSSDKDLKKNKVKFKDKYGSIPYSVMKFYKSPEFMELIDNDSSPMGTERIKRRGGGWAAKLRYSVYNPDQAFFILDYYTEPGYSILDPFMGRGTRSQMSLYLDRKYTGYDDCSETVERNKMLCEKNGFSDNNYRFFNSSGTKLEGLEEDELFDAVFTCPPYYNIEKYSNSPGDLSYMSIENFDQE